MSDNSIPSPIFRKLQDFGLKHAEESRAPSGESSEHGVWGGVSEATGPPIVFGKELALIARPNVICCAPVGVGSLKLCTDTIAQCSVQSHVRKRADGNAVGDGPFLAVIANKTPGKNGCTYVLSEPRLAVTGLASGFVQDLLQREGADWAKEFGVVHSEGILDNTDEARTKNLMKTVKKSQRSAGPESTPGKQKLRFDKAAAGLAYMEESMKNHAAWESGTAAAKATWEERKADNDGSEAAANAEAEAKARYESMMDNRVDVLIMLIDGMYKWIKEELSESRGVEAGNESAIEGLRALLAGIEGQLGSKSSIKPGQAGAWGLHPNCTLWSGLQELERVMKSMDKNADLQASEIQSFKIFQQFILKEIEAMQRSFSSGSLTDPSSMSEDEESDMGFKTPNRAGRRVNAGGFLHPTAAGAGGGDGGSSVGGGGGHFGEVRNGAEYVTRPEFNVFKEEVRRAMGERDERIARLEAEGGEGSEDLLLLGQRVRSLADISTIFERLPAFGSGARLPASCFVTPHLLMNKTYRAMASFTTKLGDHKALANLEVRDDEHQLITSMQTAMPLIFTQGRLATVIYKSKSSVSGRFPALPAFEDWGRENNNQSMSHAFFRNLTAQKDYFRKHIKEQLNRAPELELACCDMLEDSHTFVVQAMGTLEETHNSLSTSFAKLEDSWDLACFGLYEIFSKEFSDCLSSFVLRDYGEATGLRANAILVTLKIHKVVKQFLAKGVKEHSSLHSAKINYVLERGMNGGLLAGSKRKSEDQETIDALQADLAKVKGKLDGFDKSWRKKLATIESMAAAACAHLKLNVIKDKDK